MRAGHLLIIASMTLFIGVSSQSSATTLTPLAFSGSVNPVVDPNHGSPQNVTGPGTISTTLTGPSGSTATASSTVTLGIDPSVSASGSAAITTVDPSQADASANPGLLYEFEISGPTSTVPVVVTVNGLVSTSAVSQFNRVLAGGSATAQINTDFGLFQNISCNIASVACSNSFSGGTFLLDTGQVYEVQLNVVVIGELTDEFNTSSVSATLAASVDPMFAVETGFPNANQYTFDFSPGLVSTTPLPAALPLFAGGLGAIGLFAWRRKRKNIDAIATA